VGLRLKIISSLPLIVLLVGLLGRTAAASDSPIPVDHISRNAIGTYASYLKEPAAGFSLEDSIVAYRNGRFTAGNHEVLTFGIGSQPVWIHFSVSNTTAQIESRRFSIETAWLDQVDVYFRHNHKTETRYHVGDTWVFSQRPIDSRSFKFDHDFKPGVSDVFVRIETPDPMVVPMYLMPLDTAHGVERGQVYSYGFLYGFLFALLVYNALLFAGLRDTRYALYSLYLAMFLAMNVSYTGHGFKWIWPDSVIWEQWSHPVLMVLYGTTGLIFALRFLSTRKYFPRVHKAVVGYLGIVWVLLLLSILFGSQYYALLVAFTFVFLFTWIMPAMGVMALRSGQKPARYFLLAGVSAMVGAALTALSVWGFIPFNTWTFRAVDMGMLLDATLLVLALAYQVRLGQAQKLSAEQMAMLDPLTGINNRRAFYNITRPVWNVALRRNHPLSVVLLDIDSFKKINDSFGHAYGDEVLVATANVIMEVVRDQDVAARWGGEEFILLLPETDVREASTLAERLRNAIAAIHLKYEFIEHEVTASFGVAEREEHHHDLDAVISTADKYLYQSKEDGRNRITAALPSPA
jgi:diguanylate cyclase (GGDEF)-like protein